MNDLLDRIKKCVDFDAYAASKGYIGRFQRNNLPHTLESSNQAVDFLLQSPLLADKKSVSIVTNAYVIGSDDYIKDRFKGGIGNKELTSYIKPLIANYFLDRIDPSEDCWGRLAGEKLNVRDNVSDYFLKIILTSFMSVAGIRGHCLGVIEDEDILFFPHDDIGFGFISMSKDQGKIIAFQKDIVHYFSNKNFNVLLSGTEDGAAAR